MYRLLLLKVNNTKKIVNIVIACLATTRMNILQRPDITIDDYSKVINGNISIFLITSSKFLTEFSIRVEYFSSYYVLLIRN